MHAAYLRRESRYKPLLAHTPDNIYYQDVNDIVRICRALSPEFALQPPDQNNKRRGKGSFINKKERKERREGGREGGEWRNQEALRKYDRYEIWNAHMMMHLGGRRTHLTPERVARYL